MKLHANHRTCPSSRRLICARVLEQGWTLVEAAAAAGCSERTAAKWIRRYREGDHELLDRSSRPRTSPRRLPAEHEYPAVKSTGTVNVLFTQVRMTGPTPTPVMRGFWRYAFG